MDAGLNTGAGRGEKGRQRPGPWPPRIEPFVANTEHNPRELKSWARRTGFNLNVSGETTASTATSEWDPLDEKDGPTDGLDLEKGRSAKPEIEPILGRRLAGTRARAGADGIEIGPAPRAEPNVEKLGSKDGGIKRSKGEKREIGVEPPTAFGLKDEGKIGGSGLPPLGAKNNGLNGNGVSAISPVSAREEEAKKNVGKDEGQVGLDVFPDPMEQEISPMHRPPGFTGGIMENPGYGGYTLP